MNGFSTDQPLNWEAEGRRIAASFDVTHAVAVIGDDGTTTALVALGLARAQARRRRVAIADLFGETAPLEALRTTDDPHGVVDSFVHGVSLNRVAQPVRGTTQLFVLPTGSEPPTYTEIFASRRWARLSSGFREVGALLIVVAPAGAERIDDLILALDGAVVVGDVFSGGIPRSRILARVGAPGSAGDFAVQDANRAVEQATAPTRRSISRRGVRVASAAGVLLMLGLAGTALWLASRPVSLDGFLPSWLRRTDSPVVRKRGNGAPVPLARADSLSRPDTAVVPSGTATEIPTIANPADSADIAPFAVELMAANTQAGAILKLQQDGKQLPAATFAPITIQGANWYKVFSGAFATHSQADSLLLLLRQRHVLDSLSGTVVRVPLAFLIDSGLPPAAVPGVVANYADRGQPVYALRQASGTARLYAGAFETPEQSMAFAESLRSAGIVPVLVYRQGRSF